jgi:acyl carrier protein
MKREQILEVVINNLKSLVETFPENQKFDVNESTMLFGEGSNIDSLSLVSVIVDLETIFSEEYNFDISLTDDKAMTREISPFDNVGTLTDYISELIS